MFCCVYSTTIKKKKARKQKKEKMSQTRTKKLWRTVPLQVTF